MSQLIDGKGVLAECADRHVSCYIQGVVGTFAIDWLLEGSVMKQGLLATLAAGMLMASTVASADAITVDFGGVDEGPAGNPVEVDVDGTDVKVTVRNTSGVEGSEVWIGTLAAGVRNGFCFGDDVSCAFDGEVTFSRAVQNLMFYVDSLHPEDDEIFVSAYRGSTLVGSVLIDGTGISELTSLFLDFSGFGSITRLIFDDSSLVDENYLTGNGVGYSRFQFTIDATPVPEPATLALLGLGLAGLGLSRRRKSA